eukprot:m.147201 g.147201  ORF g.147201 m.147201 type:complete len:685 (+) comp11659_c0_seq1:120-2174(+)
MARVEATNDVALASKEACVQQGYYIDSAAVAMHRAVGATARRRTALVCLGYHLRVLGVTNAAKWFLEQPEVVARDSTVPPQMLVLGGGHDTMQWRLREWGVPSARFLHTFDADLPAVARSKAAAIRATPELATACGNIAPQSPHETATTLASDRYHVLAVDITDTTALEAALVSARFNFDAPTLVLSECVLAYLRQPDGDMVLKWAHGALSGPSVFVDYSPMRPHDAFGTTMTANFATYGAAIAAVQRYATPEEQRQRFQSMGWTNTVVSSLVEVLQNLPALERARLIKIEPFDELQEFFLTCHHYSIAVAVSQMRATTYTPFLKKDRVDGATSGCSPHGAMEFSWTKMPCSSFRRWDAATATVGANKMSVMFCGGFGADKSTRCRDIGMLNLKTGELQVSPTLLPTKATVGCTLSAVAGQDATLLFGGRAGPGSASNQLILVSISDLACMDLKCGAGTTPQPRWQHTGIMVCETLLLVYGGRDIKGPIASGAVIADCSSVDSGTVTWLTVEDVGDIPHARYSHGVAKHGGRMIVCGGVGASGQPLNDIFAAHVSSSAVEQTALVVWEKIVVSPKFPSRFGHSCDELPDGRLCIVGGTGDTNIMWDEQIIIMDIGNQSWCYVTMKNDVLEREIMWLRHSCHIAGGALYILGGGGACFSFGAFYSPPVVATICHVPDELHRAHDE